MNEAPVTSMHFGKPGCRIGMLMLSEFNSLAAHAFIDPFRAANYLRGSKVYDWQFLSVEGGSVTASNGSQISNTQRIDEGAPDYELLMVNASWTPERFQAAELQSWLRLASRHGVRLGGIDTGGFVLAYAGLLQNHRAVVHYEHLTAFNELFPSIETAESLYSIDKRRFTCCGGTAAVDLALELIRQQNGIELANAAARYIFKERLREGNQAQLPRAIEPVGYQVPDKLREAILLMERNIDEPLTQSELAELLALSTRQVQRIFKQYIGVTPLRYYRNVRLDRARGLVTQTELPIAEIAALSGFLRAEQFSRAYQKRFDITPIKDRIEGRIPFQFRNLSDHAGYHSID